MAATRHTEVDGVLQQPALGGQQLARELLHGGGRGEQADRRAVGGGLLREQHVLIMVHRDGGVAVVCACPLLYPPLQVLGPVLG